MLYLLPSGSEQHEQLMKYCCLGVFRKEYFRLANNRANRYPPTKILVKLGSNIKKHFRPQYPLGHHTDYGSMGLGQYNSLGKYCGPHTASSVFLILIRPYTKSKDCH